MVSCPPESKDSIVAPVEEATINGVDVGLPCTVIVASGVEVPIPNRLLVWS